MLSKARPKCTPVRSQTELLPGALHCNPVLEGVHTLGVLETKSVGRMRTASAQVLGIREKKFPDASAVSFILIRIIDEISSGWNFLSSPM